MRFCTNCGFKVTNDAAMFCPQCGTRLYEQEAQQQEPAYSSAPSPAANDPWSANQPTNQPIYDEATRLNQPAQQAYNYQAQQAQTQPAGQGQQPVANPISINIDNRPSYALLLCVIGLAFAIIGMPGIASAEGLSILGLITFVIGQSWLSFNFSRNIVAPGSKETSTVFWLLTTLVWFIFIILIISALSDGISESSAKTRRIIFTIYSFSYLIQNLVQLVCSKPGRQAYVLVPMLMSLVFCTLSIVLFQKMQDVPNFEKYKTLGIIVGICLFLSLFLKMAVQYLGASKRDKDNDLYLPSAAAKQHSLFGLGGLVLTGVGTVIAILFKVVKPQMGVVPNSSLSTVFIILEVVMLLLIAAMVVRINSMTKNSPMSYFMTALGFVLFIILIGISEGHLFDSSSDLLKGFILTNQFFGVAAALAYDQDEKSSGVLRYIAFGSLIGLAVPFLMTTGLLTQLGLDHVSWDMSLTSLSVMHIAAVLAYLPAMLKAINARISGSSVVSVFAFILVVSLVLAFVIKPAKKYRYGGYDDDPYEYRHNYDRYDYDEYEYDDYDW